jgi:hypothetical protein
VIAKWLSFVRFWHKRMRDVDIIKMDEEYTRYARLEDPTAMSLQCDAVYIGKQAAMLWRNPLL